MICYAERRLNYSTVAASGAFKADAS